MTAKQREGAFTAEQWATCRIEVLTIQTLAEVRKVVSGWKKRPECMRVRWQTRPSNYCVTLWILS